MYLKSLFPPSVVNMWFHPFHIFVFYTLLYACFFYNDDSNYFDSVEKTIFWAVGFGVVAVVFNQINRYINLKLASLEQHFFTARRWIVKTVFYIIPLLLTATVIPFFPHEVFTFRILKEPSVYVVFWVLPYEVFEYLRLQYHPVENNRLKK
jgi:hypothetical protein